jgi:hypothetical protein
MKRLIQRQQVINCGSETCGKCIFIDDFDDVCKFWTSRDGMPAHIEPLWNEKTQGKKYMRLYQCKNAEARKL